MADLSILLGVNKVDGAKMTVKETFHCLVMPRLGSLQVIFCITLLDTSANHPFHKNLYILGTIVI